MTPIYSTLFQPPGFFRRATATSRGRVDFYTNCHDADPGDSSEMETIIFLHGFGGGSSSFEWSKVYPAFSAEYRVLAPDLPGWGLSEHRVQDYYAKDYLAAIAEFITANSARPVTVVASSVVAGLVVWLATEKPDLFRNLVLMCPTGLSDFGQPFNGMVFQFIGSLPIFNYLLYSQAIASPISIRGFLENVLFARKNRVTEEMVEAYFASAHQPYAEYAAYSFLKGYSSFDLAEFLPKLNTPTAILWGEKANFAPADRGERLAALSSQVKFFSNIEDTGTVPHLELPAVAIARIRRALQVLS